MDDHERFEALYAAHAGAVRTYAARRADFATVDDVVAEVFLVAWRRADSVPEDALPWLLGTARRVLANQRRAAGRQAALQYRLRADPTTATSSRADATRGHLMETLSTLTETDREVLFLSAWEGLEPARAAKVLGLRTGTYTMRLFRARKRLELALSAQPSTSPTQPEVVR